MESKNKEQSLEDKATISPLKGRKELEEIFKVICKIIENLAVIADIHCEGLFDTLMVDPTIHDLLEEIVMTGDILPLSPQNRLLLRIVMLTSTIINKHYVEKS